jgi:hypothetical protein
MREEEELKNEERKDIIQRLAVLMDINFSHRKKRILKKRFRLRTKRDNIDCVCNIFCALTNNHFLENLLDDHH